MSADEKPDVPDLRSLLREASPPEASVTVPLKQGLAARILDAEAELEKIAADTKGKRMGAKSPLRAKAEEIAAMQDEMAASALTFHFTAWTDAEREQIRDDMAGRDDDDELNLRTTAAMCRRVVAADGTEFPDKMTWQDFKGLRETLGGFVYEATIDAACTRASGVRGWSVPFSSAASHILGTAK